MKWGSFDSVSTAPKTHKSQEITPQISRTAYDGSPIGFSGPKSSNKKPQSLHLDKIVEVEDRLEDTHAFDDGLLRVEKTQLKNNLLG